MTKNKILDISFFLDHCDPKDIRSLDIEGAPNSIKQLSVVDASMNNIFNGHFKNESDISGQKRITIAKAVRNAKILIGFNIPSDLMALHKCNFKLGEQTIVIDLYRTFLFRLNNNLESSYKGLMNGLSLKDVAAHYGITNQKGWHDSLVDSKVTMQLFQIMKAVTKNQFWVVTHDKYQNTKATLNQAGSDTTMTVQDMDLFDYAQNKMAPVVKIGKHLYQGIFVINGMKVVARMTSAEYKLYKKIREVIPNYPLQIFYLSILAPGTVQPRLKNSAKKSDEKERDASTKTGPTFNDTKDQEPPKEDDDSENTASENTELEK